uniref:Uncharacterized protein n=1 Tax=viral metagenome TaxID=1070528 RepID=A0A6C0HNC1_9ZZZZ
MLYYKNESTHPQSYTDLLSIISSGHTGRFHLEISNIKIINHNPNTTTTNNTTTNSSDDADANSTTTAITITNNNQETNNLNETSPMGSFNQYMTFSDLAENKNMFYAYFYKKQKPKLAELFINVAIETKKGILQNVLIKYKINKLVKNNSDSLNKYSEINEINEINEAVNIIIEPKSLKDTILRIAILYIYYNIDNIDKALNEALDEEQYKKLLSYLKNIVTIIKKSIHTHNQYISHKLQKNIDIIDTYLTNFKEKGNPDLTLNIEMCLYSEVNCIVLIQTIKYLDETIIGKTCAEYEHKRTATAEPVCFYLKKALKIYLILADDFVKFLPVTNECRQYIESHDIIKQLEKNKRGQITSSANA